MDTVVQKATELGVCTATSARRPEVVRLDAERSEARLAHWNGSSQRLRAVRARCAPEFGQRAVGGSLAALAPARWA